VKIVERFRVKLGMTLTKAVTISLGKSKISPWVFGFVLLFSILSSLMFWFRKMVQGATFESVIFTVKSGVSGVTSGMTLDAVRDVLLITILCMAIALGFIYFISSVKINGRSLHRTPLQIMIVIVLFLSIFLQDSIYYISSYRTIAALAREESAFIAENYINPKDANITFPDEKRNLVYIALESIENTFADTKNGGVLSKSLMPNLANLANKNISFSHNGKMGGSLFQVDETAMPGVWWTIASLVSQTSGLPLKQFDNTKVYEKRTRTILNGATTLNNILADNGYNQIFMCGSYAEFGGRAGYFSNHGNVAIRDIRGAEEEGIIPEGYNNDFWGMEDRFLYDYARLEIGRLADEDEPFAMTILTVDTHFPHGWVDDGSETKFKTQYENAVATSDKQVSEFIKWISAQDFYENTTIVLVGDHPSMSDFSNEVKEKNPNFIRTTYNCFINAAKKPVNNKFRWFCNMDIFPTMLSAIGAEYDGNRMGLGTDLFSEEETLIEKHGFEYVAKELYKASKFYEKLQ